MAKDLAYLSALMYRVGAAVQADVTNLQNGIAVSVHEFVEQATPVDVGTARSNWIVRLGNSFDFIYNAFSPHASRWHKPYANPGSDRSETENIEAARRQADAVLRGNTKGEPIYITNNLPYIAALNAGHSKQAPAGFVQSSVLSGTRSAVTLFRFTNIERLF
jgi:hypothetical protein